MFAVLAVLLLSAFVVGQPVDRIEVFGGYTYVTSDFSLVSSGGASGWNASANFKVRPSWGVVADFSGFYPSSSPCSLPCSVSGKSYTFLFGPQASLTRGRISPFARFLFGGSHVSLPSVQGTSVTSPFSSNSAFSLAAGGGVDLSVTRRIALRGQLDWLHTRFKGAGGVQVALQNNVARIATGVVFQF
jgi:opacity protein-like surface antigen